MSSTFHQPIPMIFPVSCSLIGYYSRNKSYRLDEAAMISPLMTQSAVMAVLLFIFSATAVANRKATTHFVVDTIVYSMGLFTCTLLVGAYIPEVMPQTCLVLSVHWYYCILRSLRQNPMLFANQFMLSGLVWVMAIGYVLFMHIYSPHTRPDALFVYMIFMIGEALGVALKLCMGFVREAVSNVL